MTSEEAIRCLSVHSITNGSGLCTDKQHYEAKQMAIKALEQTRWIPVSEGLPEEYGEYLITWTTSQSKKPFIAICECEISNLYNFEKNRFDAVWLLEDYIKAYPDVEIIAWMPLPEPYKAESEEQA